MEVGDTITAIAVQTPHRRFRQGFNPNNLAVTDVSCSMPARTNLFC
ncbi:hypothetical protein [Nostoc sp. ChiSLP03a]|nr:hypothetical protein [Nostoc sp. ChiSLP03a]MDZ8210191.1 hypothetical protein [Nostoc sp. ChiSLP03a]